MITSIKPKENPVFMWRHFTATIIQRNWNEIKRDVDGESKERERKKECERESAHMCAVCEIV